MKVIKSKSESLIKTTSNIWQESSEEIAFQHLVLCHLGFPRSKITVREFERRTGNTALLLVAGRLWDKTHWILQPLPYGTIPRLVMIAAITRATQQKTREIELGCSMNESLRNLGLADTGAAHWRNVAKQQTALATVDMAIGFTVNGKTKTIQTHPFAEITAWTHRNEWQPTVYPSLIILSTEFYNALETSAIPLNTRSVRALHQYPMALDAYTWLAHRLCRIRNRQGERITWTVLREQFGQEINSKWDFKKLMRNALKRAQSVYPQANLSAWEDGILLLPSPAPISKTCVVMTSLKKPIFVSNRA